MKRVPLGSPRRTRRPQRAPESIAVTYDRLIALLDEALQQLPPLLMAPPLAHELDTELPGIEALVVDDTGFPKKGEHSVAVARQYSGTLGRIDNCQVAVSLHLAGESGSGCVA